MTVFLRIAVLSLGLLLPGCVPAERVLPVYLTFGQEDATRSMTVHYHTRGPTEGSHVHYDVVPRDGDPASYAFHATGSVREREGIGRAVHVVELTRLSPGTVYYFVVGDPMGGYRAERSFETPPSGGSPLRFVAGGDMGTGLLTRMISARAAATRPHFALLAGDLAYGEGGDEPDARARWERWFADWEAAMRTPEGRLVPMLLALGNHDVRDRGRGRPAAEASPFVHFFFQQDAAGRSYFVRRFGPHAVWVLDSGHLAAPGGVQAAWLAESLAAHAGLSARFAVYHVGLYPAHHRERGARRVREAWLPLFDAFQLTAAFEGHDHLLKRTRPLRDGQVVDAASGTLYLGDGCWGKSGVRTPAPDRDYLAAAVRRRHVWTVTVTGDEARYVALGAAGQVLDEARQPLAPAALADGS